MPSRQYPDQVRGNLFEATHCHEWKTTRAKPSPYNTNTRQLENQVEVYNFLLNLDVSTSAQNTRHIVIRVCKPPIQ